MLHINLQKQNKQKNKQIPAVQKAKAMTTQDVALP